jgi:hypothetical protein
MAFLDMIYPTNPQGTQIAALRLDILVREEIEFPSIATEYPVEEGSPVSDAILPGAPKLSISGAISATSSVVLGAQPNPGEAGSSKLLDAFGAVRQVYVEHTPITVVTGLGVYNDMAMTSCKLTRTNGPNGGRWMDIQAEFTNIRKVSLKTADVPAEDKGKGGATKANAGKAAGTEPKPPTRQKGLTAAIHDYFFEGSSPRAQGAGE